MPQLLYSTPQPLSRLSVHSRASFTVSFLSQVFVKKKKVFVQIWQFFVSENALPNTVKPPLRCKFDFFVRVGALKFAQDAVYATYARFRASFAVWFRAHSNHCFGAKTG